MTRSYEGHAVYRIRRSGNNAFTISIPPEIARMIPEEQEFIFALTDEGFSYTPYEEPSEGLPEWLTRKKEKG